RFAVFGLRGFDHSVRDGAYLAVRLALADHEIVGDGSLVADVDHHRVPGFLLGCGAAQQAGQLQWRESPGPFSQQFDYPCRDRVWRCTPRPPRATSRPPVLPARWLAAARCLRCPAWGAGTRPSHPDRGPRLATPRRPERRCPAGCPPPPARDGGSTPACARPGTTSVR